MITLRSIRITVRTGLIGLAIGLTSPLWVMSWLCRALVRSDISFRFGSELLSLVPGMTGIYLRRGFYSMTLESFSSDCQICFGTSFAHSRVKIGREVVIGKHCTFGMVAIGNGVAIGSNVDILSGRHQHAIGDATSEIAVQYQPGSFTQVQIGERAWIGNSAVVMANLGAGCIIGAGSVVVHEIPPHTVAVGNPAKVKRVTGTGSRLAA